MIMLILSVKLKNQFPNGYTFALKNIVVNGDKRGCSGFISRGDSIVYVNTEVLGGGYLYRTASHLKDYKGGVNQYARDLPGLVAGVVQLLNRGTV